MKTTWLIVLVAVISIIIVGGGITGAAIVQVPYTSDETCTETVPKETTKQVCDQVPYETSYDCSETKAVVKSVPIDYVVLKDWVADSCIFATCINAYVSIKNNDDVGRDFQVKFSINKATGGSLEETANPVYISPHSTGTVSAGSYKFGIASFDYEVIPPTKEKLVNENIPKTCKKINYKTECKNVQEVTYVTQSTPCSKVRTRSLLASII